MRFTVSLLVIAAMFLTSCAYEGVIVEKRSRPHPLYHSVGIEGVYTFVLRDRAGALHRQMVTPQVFEQYAEGDYFNDLQAQASQASDYKETRTAAVPVTKPARTASRTASRAKSARSKQVASKPKTKRGTKTATASAKKPSKPIAKRTKSKNRLAQRTTRKATTKTAAKTTKKTNHRRVATKEPKPWKMTEPTVETAPAQTEAVPPAEGPAPAAAATPAPQPPPAAKPSSSPEEADIVYIPPPPR